MLKRRLAALLVLLIGCALGWAVYSAQIGGWRPFKLGLDLSGGTALTYRADTSALQASDIDESMAALRDTIERRVNAFGVAEPLVQTERGGRLGEGIEERLIVELPGITDTERAIALIGETPVLEFRMLKRGMESTQPAEHTTVNDMYEPALLTGRHLKRAELQFGNGSGLTNEPVVVLTFNAEGAQIFADATRENVGRMFGIFLDGMPISTPVIQEEIPNGTAVISGQFTPEAARELVRNMNYGALPLPIELISTQTVGSTLGAEAVERGIWSGIVGLTAVGIFMIVWYRLPGVVATLALALYGAATLFMFELIPVTLTAAGIAGFILSVGMAVDANILIFERMKEELRSGKDTEAAIRDGFARAWLSIRDSNISSIITSLILFWFGTSLVKGFALVLGLGVLVSMLTAITVSRTLLLGLGIRGERGIGRFLFGSGIRA